MEANAMTYDLIVIGGGPAGCAASITAARSGAKVLQLERGRFPRHKVCGEFVSPESLALLSRLLREQDAALVTGTLRLGRVRVFMDGVQLCGKVNPPAASITRFDLDSALWQSAIASGVDARQNSAVRLVTSHATFCVNTDQETFDTRAIINATGRWSNLTSSSIRAHVTDQRWIGIKAHFQEPESTDSVDLYFFEGGYCGVQPVTSSTNGIGAVINACAMVRSDLATTLPEVFSAHGALYTRARSWTSIIDPVTTSPLVFHQSELLNKGMLQVGDAATFVDPFIGDGISLALRGGALAAECLIPFFKQECSLKQAAGNYRAAYERKLGHVFRRSSRLRRMFLSRSVLKKPALSFLQHAPGITSALVKWTR
jgi:menaquinone-9 beta-reductase